MKILEISNCNYNVYIYDVDIDKDNLLKNVNCILKKLRVMLELKGFYKVVVCYLECGLFLQIILLEDSYYKNTVDFKIIIDNNKKIYFKTKDYFLINNLAIIKYYDGYYYGLVDNSFDKLLEKVEFGNFVFDYDSNMAIII